MVTGLSRIEPQMSAAYWKAISRCWPTVVPGLPPTGAAGVGSLKPTPGALVLTMTMLAVAKAGTLPARSRAARTRRPRARFIFLMAYLSSKSGAAVTRALAAAALSTQICWRAPSGPTWAIEMFRNEVPRSTDIVPSAVCLACRVLAERLSSDSTPAARALLSAAVGWRSLPLAGSIAAITPLPFPAAGFSPANAGAARLRTVAAARPRAARRTPFPYDLVITSSHLGVHRARSGGTGNHAGQRSRNGESKPRKDRKETGRFRLQLVRCCA